MTEFTKSGDDIIVVFGGAGFIGTHLLGHLIAIGQKNVTSIDIQAPKRPVTGVDYRIGDVRDLANIELPGTVSLIFNLTAVHTTPGHEPWEYYSTNVRGAVEICRFARRTFCRTIAFTSSISVYGPDEVAKNESFPPAPTSDYGRSKLMAEQIHQDWLAENPDRKLVTVRPAVVFGYGEGGNFTRLANMLAKGWFLYPGRRNTIKSCIYVGDLVSWIMVAIGKERSVLFNGAYSNRYTIEEIVETFRRVAFPKARTYLVSSKILRGAAALLRPFSAAGLGIHPERIEKLMVSTNILPDWAEMNGLPTKDRLEVSLREWQAQGNGKFI